MFITGIFWKICLFDDEDNSPKMIPTIPPIDVKMMECHSSLSFMKKMANEDTPMPVNKFSLI